MAKREPGKEEILRGGHLKSISSLPLETNCYTKAP